MIMALQELLSEVDRIVNSPYPTQLKTLRDLVSLRCTDSDIKRCLSLRPCYLDALADCFVEALEQSPYVLDIIARFSPHCPFRYAIWKRSPTLLHDVISQACRASLPSRYSTTAVGLLSHPLPDDIALPAPVQTLFVQLVDHAAREPSAASIRPVFRLLKGTSSSLLGLLSGQTLSEFQAKLKSILYGSSQNPGQEGHGNILALYCLAIMAMVISASTVQITSTDSFLGTQGLVAGTAVNPAANWDIQEMRDFFHGLNRARKTLQLVMLRAYEACRGAEYTPADVAQETLGLASELIRVFPQDIKLQWCQSNESTLERWQQKVLDLDADSTLALQGLGVLSALGAGDMLATAGTTLAARTTQPSILARASLGLDANQLIHCLPIVIRPQWISQMSTSLVEFLASASLEETIEANATVHLIIDRLTETLHTHDAADGSLLEPLTPIPLEAQPLQRLLDSIQSAPSEYDRGQGDNGLCLKGSQHVRNVMIRALTNFLLQAALSSRSQLPSSTAALLVEIYAVSGDAPAQCSHGIARQRCINFVEQEGTPPDRSTDWRDGLGQHLETKARADQDALSRLFAKACADLEARCEDTERPLKEERQKVATLTEALQSEREQGRAVLEELEQFRNAYQELETTSLDLEMQMKSLESERDLRQADVQEARDDLHDFRMRVESLEQRLQQAREQADTDHRRFTKAKEAAEMEQASICATNEAALGDMRDALDAAQERSARLQQDLQNVQMELKASMAASERLRDEVKDVTEELRDRESVCQRLQGEAEAARIDHQELISKHQQLQCDMQRSIHDDRQARSELQKTSETALANKMTAHQQALNRLADEHMQDVTALKQEITHLTSAHDALSRQQAAERAQHEDQVHDYNTMIKQLKHDCRVKDAQVAEANAMRANLMAAMGIGATLPSASLPHRSKPSATPSQLDGTELKISPAKPLPARGPSTQRFTEGMSFASTDSSGEARNGPTPKRPRPRKSFKASSPARPRANPAFRPVQITATGRSTVKRLPLVPLSVNRSPVRRGLKTPSKGRVDVREERDEYSEITFDENELFEDLDGSTQLSPCKGGSDAMEM